MVRKYEKKQLVGLIYITPWLIGFCLLQFYPFVMSFIYSFTDYNIIGNPVFVGLKNYITMFTNDEMFYVSLRVTMIYVLVSVPMKLISALFFAMLLNIKIKAVSFYRTMFYLPSIFGGSVAISVLWRFLFMRDGIVNGMLGVLKVAPVDWLGSPKISLFTLSLLSVWQFGSSMVLFLAGLKQVPGELYEAAEVDGAGKIRKFMTITLPMLSPIILFNLIMQTLNAFQDFTGAFVITNGGPMNSTYLYALKLYNEGFSFFKMGYASALSWVLFIIILLFSGIIFKVSGNWVHYEDGGDF